MSLINYLIKKDNYEQIFIAILFVFIIITLKYFILNILTLIYISNFCPFDVFIIFNFLYLQTVFQVLKDISHTWSWKPGVISTSYILRGSNKQKADPRSSPSLSSGGYSSKSANYDVIAEEHLKSVSDGSKSYSIPCHLPITNTETVTLQR